MSIAIVRMLATSKGYPLLLGDELDDRLADGVTDGKLIVHVRVGPGEVGHQYCSARNLHEIPNLFLFIDLHKGTGEAHMTKSLHNRKS